MQIFRNTSAPYTRRIAHFCAQNVLRHLHTKKNWKYIFKWVKHKLLLQITLKQQHSFYRDIVKQNQFSVDYWIRKEKLVLGIDQGWPTFFTSGPKSRSKNLNGPKSWSILPFRAKNLSNLSILLLTFTYNFHSDSIKKPPRAIQEALAGQKWSGVEFVG